MASRPSLRSSTNNRVATSTALPSVMKNPPEQSPIALRPSTRANETAGPAAKSTTSPSQKKRLSNESAAHQSIVTTRAASGPALAVSRRAPASSDPQSHHIPSKNTSLHPDRFHPNPRKRSFDALKSGSGLQLPNGSRMNDGLARWEPANGQYAHETLSTQSSSHRTEATDAQRSQAASNPDESRSLRSKAGGSRLKSDLATYFPNFEDVISGVTPEPGKFCSIVNS
jgi:hypothetical protein